MSNGDTVRAFPVLWPYARAEIAALKALECPRQVPWDLVAPHAAQAECNHGQTLDRLNERGGLSPCELVAVLENRRWRTMADEASVMSLLSHLSAFESPER